MTPEGIAAAKRRAELAMIDARRSIDREIQYLQSEAAMMGSTLQNSSYILGVFGACSEEISRRARTAWGIARRVIDSEGYFLADDNRVQIREIIQEAVTQQSRDLDELWLQTRDIMKGPWHDLAEPRQHAIATAMADVEIDLIARKARRAPLTDELAAPRYNAVRGHWARAHQLAGDPLNVANAVKEAASAVESMAQVVLRKPGITLGDAVKELRSQNRLPVGADKVFEGLYAFANSAPGARHGSALPPDVDPSHWGFVRTTAEGALRLLIDIDT